MFSIRKITILEKLYEKDEKQNSKNIHPIDHISTAFV
jgi:hypothetical protein